jgi:hypothetical protein
MVRACLGIRDGSGAHVTLLVRYDGANGGVAGVDVQTDAADVGERERVCVMETVRGSIRPDGTTSAVTVRQEYEF